MSKKRREYRLFNIERLALAYCSLEVAETVVKMPLFNVEIIAARMV